MATTTLNARQSRTGRGRWIAAGIVLIVVAIIAGLLISRSLQRSATQIPDTTTIATGPIVATVVGSGSVAAARTLDVTFQSSGQVTEVLVQEGQLVTAGQPLAKIDNRDLVLQVSSAQASLTSAQAQLQAAQEGSTTPQDIAAQQAAVSSAEANLRKTRSGSFTQADIASAQASVRSAQAQLDALKNPSPDKISSAQLSVTQAANNLQSVRDDRSTAKTRANLDMQRAVETLTQAQSKYATAKQQWEYVRDTGKDPVNPTTTNSQGKAVANTLNDTERQQYYDSFVQAESSMRSAEQSLEQYRIAFDNARQAEVVDVNDAEAKLADTKAQLAALQNPTATDITQKQAALDQAKATLQKYRQGGTANEIAVSQASLDQAHANLEKLTAPAAATDIAQRQASVTQAQQSLEQAKLSLDKATLTAPFDGIVTSVSIVPGSVVGSATAAVSLMDRSTLHVDLKLSENDVAKASLGQQVKVSFDSVNGYSAIGKVSYIAPAATTTNDVVTYKVQVSFPDSDARVKIGMTASLVITTATKESALLVPNTALSPKGAGRAVQVLGADGKTTEVEVQTGLTDNKQTEITAGLKVGDKVVTNPNAAAPARTGLFGR